MQAQPGDARPSQETTPERKGGSQDLTPTSAAKSSQMVYPHPSATRKATDAALAVPNVSQSTGGNTIDLSSDSPPTTSSSTFQPRPEAPVQAFSGASGDTTSTTKPSTTTHGGDPVTSPEPHLPASTHTAPPPVFGRRVSTSDSPSLQQPIPKPRSNSALQSSRPAPPSPAPSRPASQLYSPSAGGSASPIPSSPGGGASETVGNGTRDRAGSTSSAGARVARRPSGSTTGRASSKPRPRSALGASFFAPDEAPLLDSGASPSGATGSSSQQQNTGSLGSASGSLPPVTTSSSISGNPPSAALPDTSLTSTAIPEHPSPSSPSTDIVPPPAQNETASTSPTAVTSTSPTVASATSTPARQTVIIRDYAFAADDPRFAGPGLPLSAPDGPSRRSSRWFGGSGDDASGSRKSWSGFGLFSFKNFMRGGGRRDSNDQSASGSGEGDIDGDRGEEDEYPIAGPEHDHDANEDDYAFSSDSGLEEDEPWGLYRAIYPFEAVGEHEIGLEEGDLIDLRGRNGGDGWVIGVKKVLDAEGKVVTADERGEREGLAPESYLEKVDLKILLRERAALGSKGSSANASEEDTTRYQQQQQAQAPSDSSHGHGKGSGHGHEETIMEGDERADGAEDEGGSDDEGEARTPTITKSKSLRGSLSPETKTVDGTAH